MAIRSADPGDVEACVGMIEARRRLYETFEPRFWRKTDHSAAMSTAFFGHLATDAGALFLVSDSDGQIDGFLIAMPVQNPPVYAPGGPTAQIDDFCVADPSRFSTVGAALLDEARKRLKARGFTQLVVVCAARDEARTAFLESQRLSLTTTWWTTSL
ncbi:MAG: GNAT family N-acetyltransferase [Caulobacter sp.]|nr:GNAT family N-acetyltransferase [Caulobacter sp.]